MTYTTCYETKMKLKRGKIGKWTHELTRSWSFGQAWIFKPVERNSILVMTDIHVSVYYVAVLRLITSHVFSIW